MLKRIAGLFMAVSVLLSCAAYAEETEPVIEEIVAEEDVSEEVILMDGSPDEEEPLIVLEVVSEAEAVRSASGTYCFPRPYGYGNATADFHYEDAFFSGSSRSYDHALARMSLAVSQSANEVIDNIWQYAPAYTFLPTQTDIPDTPAVNAVKLLKECGFEDFMINRDFLISTAYDGVNNDGSGLGVLVARKELENGVTLLAAAVRGGGYGCEWVGNFHICSANGGLNHPGFDLASRRITEALERYVSELGIDGRAKLWMSGYSRGAAAVNLAAASLCRTGLAGCDLSAEDIYAYTFESPMATKDQGAEDALYGGIWNIINMTDPVTCVLPRRWGYTRYGNTLYLPCRWQNAGVYSAYETAVLERFCQLRGEAFSDIPKVNMQTWLLRSMFEDLADTLGGEDTAKAYMFQRAVQTFLKHAYRDKTTADSEDFALSIFKTMLSAAGMAMLPDGSEDYLRNVLYSHLPELSIAWMDTIPAGALSVCGTLTYVTVKGGFSQAVVYDASGVEALVIDRDGITRADGTVFDAVSTNGKLVFCIPGGEYARIELNASGRETSSITMERCVFPGNDIVDLSRYSEVSVRKNDSLTAEITENGYRVSKDGRELPPDGTETLSVRISEDGRTASFTGDTLELYVRAALVLEGAGGSGLYVTQVPIGPDGTAELPALQVPGISVRGINVALVRSLEQITSPVPEIVLMDYRIL